MTINERVSDERLIKPEIRDSKYWNGLEFKCDLYHLDMQDFYTYANMLTGADYRELQQYRAAAEPVAWMVIDSDSGEKILRVDRSNIEGAAIPLYAAPQVTSVPDDAFERALLVLNDTLDDCGDSERGLLLALDRMGIEVGEPTDDERLMEIEDVGSWANNRNTPTAAPAVQAEQTKRLIGWRTADYTEETSDPEMAKNWAAVVGVLPVFEGDINTRLQAEQLSGNTEQVEPVSDANKLGGWIPVSERMPGSRHAVLVGRWFGSEWTSKWATYVPGHPDAQDSGWLIPGASWTPTHWHELPAAPKQEAE